jgi:hypothetical protein
MRLSTSTSASAPRRLAVKILYLRGGPGHIGGDHRLSLPDDLRTLHACSGPRPRLHQLQQQRHHLDGASAPPTRCSPATRTVEATSAPRCRRPRTGVLSRLPRALCHRRDVKSARILADHALQHRERTKCDRGEPTPGHRKLVARSHRGTGAAGTQQHGGGAGGSSGSATRCAAAAEPMLLQSLRLSTMSGMLTRAGSTLARVPKTESSSQRGSYGSRSLCARNPPDPQFALRVQSLSYTRGSADSWREDTRPGERSRDTTPNATCAQGRRGKAGRAHSLDCTGRNLVLGKLEPL